MCPEELAAMVNAVSLALSKGRCIEELNLLSAAFTQIGDTLATIAVQRQNICNCQSKSSEDENNFPL